MGRRRERVAHGHADLAGRGRRRPGQERAHLVARRREDREGFLSEGSAVKKGDVVAVLRVPDLGKIRGAQIAATSKARAATTNAERLKALVEQRLASDQALSGRPSRG